MSDDYSNAFMMSHGESDPDAEQDLLKKPSLRGGLVKGAAAAFNAWTRTSPMGRDARNVLIAGYDALKNVGETLVDAAVPSKARGIAAAQNQPTLSTLITGGKTGSVDVDLYDLMPEFMREADKVRDLMAMGSNTEDVVTQKMMQFAVPFGGTMKLLGGMANAGKAVQVARVIGADALVSGTVWDPHEGRFADLLRQLAPDSQLVNAATDYLASDPSDSDAEGRWKNVLDSQLAAGVVGPFLFAGGAALRKARIFGKSKPKDAVKPEEAQ